MASQTDIQRPSTIRDGGFKSDAFVVERVAAPPYTELASLFGAGSIVGSACALAQCRTVLASEGV
jgi:hypothetical protein